MPLDQPPPVPAQPSLQIRFRGCLLGGAVGDALGAPVELLSISRIIQQFGALGIQDFVPVYQRLGAVTDDTQLTLFTAEALLRSWMYVCRGGVEKTWLAFMHESYRQWLETQDPVPSLSKGVPVGWLASHSELWHRRGPGSTCLSALRAALPGQAKNQSKGCGGIMRAAPIGLWFSSQPVLAPIFDAAVEMAAITHGHHTGSLSAGVFAVLIALLVRGETLRAALPLAKQELQKHPAHGETLCAIDAAERLLLSPSLIGPAAIERLGGGWVAEEALAIALYCALSAETFEQGVILAVNHSGDSDSTGSMTGNLLGCFHGFDSIPARWLAPLELRDVIVQVADDLLAARSTTLDPGFEERYASPL